MPLMINSNIASLNAQRQLTSAGAELDQASERLSSGKRINSASDDAAGLSIANRFTSQIRGLDQAVRNANDGISLIQTAEGALDESTNILQRMRELAVQSSNGIYSDTDRATLDAEVQQLVQELDRISETTSFNGQKILDGTQGSIELQVGSEANETISFEIAAVSSATLGLGSTSSDLSGDSVSDLTAINSTDNTAVSFGDGDIAINGQSLSAFNGGAATPDTLQTLIDDINTNISGVTASGFNVIEASTAGTGIIGDDQNITVSVYNATDNSQTDFTIATATDLADFASKVNTSTGGLVDASVNDNGRLVLSNDTGAAIGLTASGTSTSTSSLDDILGINTTTVSDQGGSNPSVTTELFAGGTDAALFTGNLALSSDDGSDISITKGANGTDADLANLGFRETSSGELTGIALSSSDQSTALAAGDLIINGTTIAASTAAAGLQGKVDNINDVSSATGVVANAEASQSYTFDATTAPAEVTAATAYAAPTTSFSEVRGGSAPTAPTVTYSSLEGAVPSASSTISGNAASTTASDFDFDTSNASIVIGADTVTLNSDVMDLDGLVNEINSQLTGDVGAQNVNGTLTFTDSNNSAFTVVGSAVGATLDAATGLTLAGSATETAVPVAELNNTYLGAADASTVAAELDFSAADDSDVTINGTVVSLNTAYANFDAMVLDINNQLSTAGNAVSASNENGRLAFHSDTLGSNFTISATDNGTTSFDTASGTTIVASGGTAADVDAYDFESNNAAFTVDGTAIALTDDVADLDGLVDAINGQLGAALSTTTAVNDNGVLAFHDPDAAAFTVGTSSGAGLNAATGLNAVGTTLTASSEGAYDYSGPNKEVSFDLTVAGGSAQTVTLDTNLGDVDSIVDRINLQLTGAEAFVDTDNGNALAFRNTTDSTSFTIDNASVGTEGTTGDLNDLVGFDLEGLNVGGGSQTSASAAFLVNGTNIDLTSSLASDQSISAAEVATAVNALTNTHGVTAYVDSDSKLHFSSDDAFTLSDDANETGFVNSLDTGGSLIAGSHGQSFSEVRGTAAPTDFDFSGGAANNVAFAINDGTADTTVTLTTDLTDLAGIVGEINTQLTTGSNSVEAFADEEGFLAFRKTTSSNDGSFTVTAGTVGSAGDLVNATGISTIETSASTSAARTGSININGFEVAGISLGDKDAAVTTINAAQANTGVTAALDKNGEVKLSANAAITLEVGQDDGVALGKVLGVNFVDSAGGANGVLDTQTVNASISLESINDTSSISIEVTADGATATGLKDLNTDLGATVTGSALSSISVGSAAGAQNAIESIDVALETINSTRSDLGAINNRLDFTVSNLSNVSENASAARSRIMDADFASETAALSRSQVLQQASQAMLAQANARPQQVLSLLN